MKNDQECACADPNKVRNLNYEERRKIQVEGNKEFYRNFLAERAFNYPQNVLFYSLIMAHEFKDRGAYYDVYILTSLATNKAGVGAKYENIMKEFALPYLYKSAELGFEDAIQTISHLDSTKVY